MRRADRIEIVRRARAQGMSINQIDDLCGIPKAERYFATERLGEAS